MHRLQPPPPCIRSDTPSSCCEEDGLGTIRCNVVSFGKIVSALLMSRRRPYPGDGKTSPASVPQHTSPLSRRSDSLFSPDVRRHTRRHSVWSRPSSCHADRGSVHCNQHETLFFVFFLHTIMPSATDRAGKSKSFVKGRKNTVPREKTLKMRDSSEMTRALNLLLMGVVCFFGGMSLVCFCSM